MPAAPRTGGVRATMNDELRAGSEAAPLRAAFPARRPDMHEAEAKAARTIRARATSGRALLHLGRDEALVPAARKKRGVRAVGGREPADAAHHVGVGGGHGARGERREVDEGEGA